MPYRKLPSKVIIQTDLLEPCGKSEISEIIKEKGLRTIEQHQKKDLVHAYTDGSSERTITNGGSRVFLTTIDYTPHQGKFGAGTIASNFTVEALNMYKALPPPEKTIGLCRFL